MALSIAILSPHLDDAALSCADHIRAWKQRGDRVSVITLFTHFGSSPCPSGYMRQFMEKEGFSDVADYERARRAEDVIAMDLVGTPYVHAGLIDAGFRERDGQPCYPDYRTLTPYQVDAGEAGTLRQVEEFLARQSLPDLVVAPLGVGGHIDHLLTREAAAKVWASSSALAFYVEFPYGLRPWKYRPSHLGFLRKRRVSMLKMSQWKPSVLAPYKSQMPYLFRGKPFYPEVLLMPK